MRVIDEPFRDIRPPRLKATRRRLPHQRLLAGGQVPADRLAVPARVPADRRLIPAARSQSMYLHVVLLCEHPHRSLSLVMASEPVDGEGDPRQTARRARGDRLRLVPTELAYVEPPARGLRGLYEELCRHERKRSPCLRQRRTHRAAVPC